MRCAGRFCCTGQRVRTRCRPLSKGPQLMPVPTTDRVGDGYDANPDFVYAVSLLAALEATTGQDEHAMVLPFLGMARAELTDFGQRRPSHYVPVEVGELRSGLADLEERL